MADIQLTDSSPNPQFIKADLHHPSSLWKYLKSELLHLTVVPDFWAKKDQTLSSVAGAKPLQFDAQASHDFKLGSSTPVVDVTPGLQAALRANAVANSNLFDGDPFHQATTVPNNVGYVGLGFTGSLKVAANATSGDFTFGIEDDQTIAFEYLRACPTTAKLGDATQSTLNNFVIPASLADLDSLALNDIATVSGQGSLQVSGGVSVSPAPNLLASLNLPFQEGPLNVNAGSKIALQASFTITGAYQICARRVASDALELSFLRKRGTAWKAELTASTGISVTQGTSKTDLLGELVGNLSANATLDQNRLCGLKDDERKTLNDALKKGFDRSLQVSLDATLASSDDNQVSFQYRIQPGSLNDTTRAAVQSALAGDLRGLTALELDSAGASSSILGPGVTLLNSVLQHTRDHGITFKLNLIGIVNLLSISDLILKSETLVEDGEVTIKQTVTGDRISALQEGLRQPALSRLMFESMIATATYRAANSVSLPTLECDHMHFSYAKKTDSVVLGAYLEWFVKLGILSENERKALLTAFHKTGPSTCILRTALTNDRCGALFFNASGTLRTLEDYLAIGRKALQDLLDPQNQVMDGLRAQLLNDTNWPKALKLGPPDLGTLVGLSKDDPKCQVLRNDYILITNWAGAMVAAGKAVNDLRQYVEQHSGATSDPVYEQKRQALLKPLVEMVANSPDDFSLPWGMLALYRASGAEDAAYGRAVAGAFQLERGMAQNAGAKSKVTMSPGPKAA